MIRFKTFPNTNRIFQVGESGKPIYPSDRINEAIHYILHTYTKKLTDENWRFTVDYKSINDWQGPINCVYKITFFSKTLSEEEILKESLPLATEVGFICNDKGIIIDFDWDKFNENKPGIDLGLL